MTQTTEIWDCLMVGAGPASLAAAVYTAREDIKTILVEKGNVGGLAAITDRVDNYPGFSEGIGGLELAQQFQAQAERFGAKIEFDAVVDIQPQAGIFEVLLASSKKLSARSVLLATGSEWKQLGIPGESEFYGRGIHNCATCDGAFYRDKKLVIVGGGNSATQEALFLTKFASEIEILVRKDSFKASEILIQEVLNHPQIKVRFKTKPLAFLGEEKKLSGVQIDEDGQTKLLPTDGVFVFIGLRPVTDFLPSDLLDLDDRGFIKTDDNFMTSRPGIFCAGDVRSGATMQIASVIGEGASSALAIRHFLDNN